MLDLAPRQLATLLVRALGDVPGHEFHGNQWTDGAGGLGLDKNGYDAQGKPGPVIARKGGVLWRYRGGGIDAQDELRSGVAPRDMSDADRKDVILLDKAMKPLGKAQTVIRDVADEKYTGKVGETLVEHGYTSTAYGRGTIAKGHTVEIEVPAHAPAIRIGDYYKDDVEKEIILPRGSKFEVVGPNKWRWVGTHKALGDYAGHEFHGNQWTHGVGGNEWRKIDRHEGQVLNNVAMHTVHDPDFSQSVNPAIHEPELVVPKGKHASAGVVMTEPDGRVWVVEPHNRYGGYRNTFPKGTVDEGESLQETAAREVWEETGLVTKITGHLVDVERSTSVARFYTGVRVGGAPWAAGKETHAVKLMPIHGKGAENNLKSVFGRETSDRKVLDALRSHLKQKTLSVKILGDLPGHEFHGNQYTGSWPEGLKNISGAKGSNPGGLYVDKQGQKWYVKRYNNPQQAQTEHIANAIYRAVGVEAPHSVLGEGGDYASKVISGEGTLAKVGLTKDRANKILDGFAADVFLDNWDAVGTGHDNILISGDRAIRIDQGGTLTFRAQGAPKPEAGLEKIGEWESLVNQNHYYNAIFKAAGVKSGDALGERAAKQIDKIVAARPKGGWKELIDKVAPKADASFRAKAARMLEARQKLLEQKRDQLRVKALGDVPGHEFHGNQWTEGEALHKLDNYFIANDKPGSIVLFHGTASSGLESIREKGLVPKGGLGADHDLSKTDSARVQQFQIGDRAGSVFLAYDSETAKLYATRAARSNPGSKSVLLAIRVPKDVAHKGDEFDSQAVRFNRSIPPEWIRRVGPNGELTALANNDDVVVYAVVMFDDRDDEIKAAEWDESKHPRNPAGGPDGGEFTSTGGSGVKKKKAPKAPPVSIEAKKAAYAEVKAGGTFKNTAAKYGMTQGQLAGHVWKVDQAKKKAEEALEEEAALKSVVKAKPAAPAPPPPATPSGKYWVQMTQDEKLAYAHKEGLQWLPKPNSQHGNHAWFNAQGQQVSAYGPKEAYREKLDTINQGKGLGPEKPPTPDVHAEFGVWPITPDVERSLSSNYQNKMIDHHIGWSNKLTSNEVNAIHSYTASGYSELNSNLRNGVALSGHQATTNAGLNTAINKAPSPPPPELVWRGISSQTVAAKFAALSVGDSFQMGGFQSTSISPKFAHSWGSGGTLFEIKPTKGAYVKLRSSHPSEQEYLLPHNAKYTVRGVAHIKMQGVSGKVRVLQLEMH